MLKASFANVSSHALLSPEKRSSLQPQANPIAALVALERNTLFVYIGSNEAVGLPTAMGKKDLKCIISSINRPQDMLKNAKLRIFERRTARE